MSLTAIAVRPQTHGTPNTLPSLLSIGDDRLFRADVGIVGDFRRIDWLDQVFRQRLAGEGGVDHDDIVETGIGSELGQHLLLGVEEIVDHLVAGRLFECLDRPGFVGAVALPVEHMHIGGLGR